MIRLSKAAVARWHRWTGLALTAPLLAWLISAFALHLIVDDAPNGLQGVYDLNVQNSIVRTLDANTVHPVSILTGLRDSGVEEVYSVRLESHGPHTLYVVRPTPYSLEQTFEATTGRRIDPLPDSILLAIAGEHLAQTTAVRIAADVSEYHRDYDVPFVPAARIIMDGAQPSELILSRSSGRPLRRLDAIATGFEGWYRALHVFQWGSAMAVFTTILYVTAAGVVVLAALGAALWVWRRGKRRPRAFLWHGRLGMTVGVFLAVEVLVGAYMWLSLGPLQDPFRGKNTFAKPWSGGISTADSMAGPDTVLDHVTDVLGIEREMVQMIEWRQLDGQPVWLVRPNRAEPGYVFKAGEFPAWEPVPPEVIGRTVQHVMVKRPDFEFLGEREYYWNDLNRPVPVYHFRFSDAASTDVYASSISGEVVSRRTNFWRAFSPFLMVHSAAFTRDAQVNELLLYGMLIMLTSLVASGWWVWWRSR